MPAIQILHLSAFCVACCISAPFSFNHQSHHVTIRHHFQGLFCWPWWPPKKRSPLVSLAAVGLFASARGFVCFNLLILQLYLLHCRSSMSSHYLIVVVLLSSLLIILSLSHRHLIIITSSLPPPHLVFSSWFSSLLSSFSPHGYLVIIVVVIISSPNGNQRYDIMTCGCLFLCMFAYSSHKFPSHFPFTNSTRFIFGKLSLAVASYYYFSFLVTNDVSFSFCQFNRKTDDWHWQCQWTSEDEWLSKVCILMVAVDSLSCMKHF